jgi:BlaI family penicillinase repressor
MRISSAERVVMEALWHRHPITAEEITAEVLTQQKWGPATVKTLINRLLKKQAIGAEREGRRYRYSPLLDRADYVHAESRSLIDRLFDGRLAPLVSHFSQRQQLTRRDIAELKQLIEELGDGD